MAKIKVGLRSGALKSAWGPSRRQPTLRASKLHFLSNCIGKTMTPQGLNYSSRVLGLA